MSVSTRPRWVYELALLLTIVVWGVNFAVVRAALEVMPPFFFNALRFVLSALLVGGFTWREHAAREEASGPPRGTRWLQVALLGLLGHFAYQVCFVLGLERTTAGSAALIMASSPLWTALLSHLFGYERLRSRAWLGLFVAFVGTVVVVWTGGAEVRLGGAALVGNLLMLAAAVAWGGYTAFNRPLLRHYTPVGITFYSMLAALPLLWLLAATEAPQVEWSRYGAWVWLAIVYSGAFSTGIAYLIWAGSVRRVGASHTAAYANLTPIAALLSGLVLLDEAILPLQLAGGACILAGLMIVRRSR